MVGLLRLGFHHESPELGVSLGVECGIGLSRSLQTAPCISIDQALHLLSVLGLDLHDFLD
jgi:hypothetical protein